MMDKFYKSVAVFVLAVVVSYLLLWGMDWYILTFRTGDF